MPSLLPESTLHHAGRAAALIALVWLAWVGAGMVWALGGASAQAPPSSALVVAANQAEAEQEAPARYADVAALPLFGEPDTPGVAAVEAPDTQLRVQLTGIAAIGASGAAIVRVNNGAERLVRVGDALGTGNAKIAEVRADRVLLERDGRYETLRLPRADGRSAAARPAPARTAALSSERSRPAGRTNAALVTAPEVVSVPSSSTDEGAAGDVPSVSRSEWLENPERLMETVRIRPVNRDGQFVGISLQPTRNQREFARAGLEAGDIVTAVNGIAVSSISNPESLLSDMQGSERVDLAIERGGMPMNLSVQLRP